MERPFMIGPVVDTFYNCFTNIQQGTYSIVSVPLSLFLFLHLFKKQHDLSMSSIFGLLLVAMQTGEATVENSMEFPQKTKNGTAL